MKALNFVFAAALGGLVYHIWAKSTAKAERKEISAMERVNLLSDVITEESEKYTDILKKQYKIIMPADLISKKAKRKADVLNEGRFAIDLNKVKEPVTI